MENNSKKLGSVLARTALAKLSLPVLLILIGLLVLIVLVVASVFSSDMGSSGSLAGGNKQLSDKVLKWEDDIEDSIAEHGLDPEYLPTLLAILQQESGGDMIATNGDIFQSSESKCGSIGCITDPQESIDQAVKHFKANVKRSKGNERVAIASYNFGNGFADWTQKNHANKWSKEIAIDFSQHMMEQVSNPGNYSCSNKEKEKKNACYGDVNYVTKIVAYLPNQNGNSEEVDFSGDLDFPLGSLLVTSNFGLRTSPVSGSGESNHKGIDLDCVGGLTPISAAGSGQVVASSNVSGYGNTVVVKHEEGFFTQYAHMSMTNVDVNDYVKLGTQVGVCGNTGNSTGSHLHFETKKQKWGKQMNPRNFLNFPAEY